MTAPSAETIEREKDSAYLLTDVELIRKLRVPERIGRAALIVLDGDPKAKFPPKLELWGGRRWWPDVMKWFTENSRKIPNGAARLITENRDELRNRMLRRTSSFAERRSNDNERPNATENT